MRAFVLALGSFVLASCTLYTGDDAPQSSCSAELCNGRDDDCDGSIDEDFALELGNACDGGDDGSCEDGVLVCSADGLGTVCNDDGRTDRELCNGTDDDCDGEIDEDFAVGSACDGTDSDLCSDGMTVCAPDGRGTICEDPGDALELCNGLDDDCDPATEDGRDEPSLGMPCDGGDGDQCAEGSTVCDQARLVCNDATGQIRDVCNMTDDDCDGDIDEDIDTTRDQANCGYCGNVCRNANGTTTCTNSACTPTCAIGAEDCNGDPDDGCEVRRDRNPTCNELAGTGTIAGDSGSQTVQFTGTDEAYLRVVLQEVSTATSDVTGRIDLDVPDGVDFDLNVYCQTCGDTIMGSSYNGPGMRDSVPFRARDVAYVNDDQTVYIEIKFKSAVACGEWKLTVSGHVSAPTVTCGS